MPKETDIIIELVIIFTIVLFVLGLLFFMLFNKYNQKLMRRQREAINNLLIGQQSERERIARDLHDGMGAELASIIHVVEEIELEDPATIKIKERAKLKLKNAIQAVRQISHDLMPSALNIYGLFQAIERLIDNHSGKDILINFTHNREDEILKSEIESHLYKITQELILNSIKHSEATEIWIDIFFITDKNQVEYTFADNGNGFDENKKMEGIGIKNIKTRVTLMNGILNMKGNDGFKLSILLDT